jgi:hypothetical protein
MRQSALIFVSALKMASDCTGFLFPVAGRVKAG